MNQQSVIELLTNLIKLALVTISIFVASKSRTKKRKAKKPHSVLRVPENARKGIEA